MISQSTQREVKKHVRLALEGSGLIVEPSHDIDYAFMARRPHMVLKRPVYLLMHEKVLRYYKLLRDAANYLPKNAILVDVEVQEDGSFRAFIYTDPKRAFVC